MKQHFQRCTTRKEGGDCLDIYTYTSVWLFNYLSVLGERRSMGSEAAKTDVTPSINRKFVGYIHNVSTWQLIMFLPLPLSYSKRYYRAWHRVRATHNLPHTILHAIKELCNTFFNTAKKHCRTVPNAGVCEYVGQVLLHSMQFYIKNSQKSLVLSSAISSPTMQQMEGSERNGYWLIPWTAHHWTTSEAMCRVVQLLSRFGSGQCCQRKRREKCSKQSHMAM